MQNFLKRILCCFIPVPGVRRMVRKYKFGRYKIHGKNNVIRVDGRVLPRWLVISGINIEIKGNNNTISIGPRCRFANSKILVKNDNTVFQISENCVLHNIFIRAAYGDCQQCTFGSGCTLYGAYIILDENSGVNIGNNCLFANNVDIWGSDGHSVIDTKTNEIINPVHGPIVIGDNCWVGQGVRILKNARIPSNTIVGGGCVVGKRFETEYTAIAGNPARVIRENVTWDNLNPMRLIKLRKENKND